MSTNYNLLKKTVTDCNCYCSADFCKILNLLQTVVIQYYSINSTVVAQCNALCNAHDITIIQKPFTVNTSEYTVPYCNIIYILVHYTVPYNRTNKL